MGDRFAAQIWIGGSISIDLIDGLVEALWRDEASHAYGEPPIPRETKWDGLHQYLQDRSPFQGVLCFQNDRADNGEFELTENFCLRNNIPFNRQSDHFNEHDAENVHFRPGMNSPTITYADAHGNEIVDGDTVREAMGALDAAIEKWVSPNTDGLGVAKQVSQLLHCACPDKADELPKFEVVT